MAGSWRVESISSFSPASSSWKLQNNGSVVFKQISNNIDLVASPSATPAQIAATISIFSKLPEAALQLIRYKVRERKLDNMERRGSNTQVHDSAWKNIADGFFIISLTGPN